MPPPHIFLGTDFLQKGRRIPPRPDHHRVTAPALDVLFIPGGEGVFVLSQANDTSVDEFITSRFEGLDYLLSVCTGAAILAKAGVLEGKRATNNKAAWGWVTRLEGNVSWVPSARWTEDGNVWTSSGVAAGLDMAYAFLKHLYGTDELDPVMNGIEHAPHTNPHWDPFSVVHNVPGADKKSFLVDCVGFVGH